MRQFVSFTHVTIVLVLSSIPALAQQQGRTLDEFVSTHLKDAGTRAFQDKAFPLASDFFTGTLAVVEPQQHLHVKIENLKLADDELTFSSTVKARVHLKGQLRQGDGDLAVDVTADVELKPEASIEFQFHEGKLVIKPKVHELLADLKIIKITSPAELNNGAALYESVLKQYYVNNKTTILDNMNQRLGETPIHW